VERSLHEPHGVHVQFQGHLPHDSMRGACVEDSLDKDTVRLSADVHVGKERRPPKVTWGFD
jgi:hypothetical protein